MQYLSLIQLTLWFVMVAFNVNALFCVVSNIEFKMDLFSEGTVCFIDYFLKLSTEIAFIAFYVESFAKHTLKSIIIISCRISRVLFTGSFTCLRRTYTAIDVST